MVIYIKLGDYVLTQFGTGRVTKLGFRHGFSVLESGEVYDSLGETEVTVKLADGVSVIVSNSYLLANLEHEPPRGELVMRVACNKD